MSQHSYRDIGFCFPYSNMQVIAESPYEALSVRSRYFTGKGRVTHAKRLDHTESYAGLRILAITVKARVDELRPPQRTVYIYSTNGEALLIFNSEALSVSHKQTFWPIPIRTGIRWPVTGCKWCATVNKKTYYTQIGHGKDFGYLWQAKQMNTNYGQQTRINAKENHIQLTPAIALPIGRELNRVKTKPQMVLGYAGLNIPQNYRIYIHFQGKMAAANRQSVQLQCRGPVLALHTKDSIIWGKIWIHWYYRYKATDIANCMRKKASTINFHSALTRTSTKNDRHIGKNTNTTDFWPSPYIHDNTFSNFPSFFVTLLPSHRRRQASRWIKYFIEFTTTFSIAHSSHRTGPFTLNLSMPYHWKLSPT